MPREGEGTTGFGILNPSFATMRGSEAQTCVGKWWF